MGIHIYSTGTLDRITNEAIKYFKEERIKYINYEIHRGLINSTKSNNNHNTYFHLACKYNFPLSTILYYIKIGASRSSKNKQNKSPLELLNKRRQQELYNYAINKLKEVIRPVQINEFIRKYVIYNPKSCYIKRLVSNF
jgi:hypothetical protein